MTALAFSNPLTAQNSMRPVSRGASVVPLYMEATIIRYIIGYISGLFWDNGQENGSHYVIMGYIFGLYGDI